MFAEFLNIQINLQKFSFELFETFIYYTYVYSIYIYYIYIQMVLKEKAKRIQRRYIKLVAVVFVVIIKSKYLKVGSFLRSFIKQNIGTR